MIIDMKDVAIALFGRKTTQGRLNKLIDSVAEGDFVKDTALHALNEIAIHKHPRQFMHNTIKYGIGPWLNRKRK